MALSDFKITSAEITQNGVISAPSKLTGTAAQNKAVFDKLITAVVAEKFNDLIDEIEDNGASDMAVEIVGLAAETVKAALEELLAKTLNAVTFASQSLTEEQKAQARSNIGVSGTAVAVNSVNGKTGEVVLVPSDIGAVASVNGRSGNVTLTGADVGLDDAVNPLKAVVDEVLVASSAWTSEEGISTIEVPVTGMTAAGSPMICADFPEAATAQQRAAYINEYNKFVAAAGRGEAGAGKVILTCDTTGLSDFYIKIKGVY